MAGRTKPQPLLTSTPPLPRDPATDRSNLVTLQTIGLAYQDPQVVSNPQQLAPVNPRVSLGRATRTTATVSAKTGRPDFYGSEPVLVQARNLNALPAQAIGPGTIRRNVRYQIDGAGIRGLFSAASSSSANPSKLVDPTSPLVYLASSLWLQLSRPLMWVVTGKKPLFPDGPSGQHYHVELARASGWPVIAPNVPSFGARVPLLRPPGLVANT